MDKISVITICYNEEKGIERTLKSVLHQTYKNYEYVVKDGGSTDSTNKIVESYRPYFEKKGCKFIHIQNRDAGIYDAMNIAQNYCSGKWLNYMNAGDCFYNAEVLQEIFEYKNYDTVDILYGHTLCELEKGYSYIIKNNHYKIREGIGISQQVCFYKKEILQQRNFLTKYKILGDFEYLFYAINAGLAIKPVNIIVAKYNRQGISSMNTYVSFLEKSEILGQEIKFGDKLKERLKKIFTEKFKGISDLLFCIHTGKMM